MSPRAAGANSHIHKLCLQVGSLTVDEPQPGRKRMLGMVADGETTMAAGFSSDLIQLHASEKLVANSLIKVINCQTSQVDGKSKMMVLGAQVVGAYDGADLFGDTEEPPRKRPAPVSAMQPAGGGQAPVSPSECAAATCVPSLPWQPMTPALLVHALCRPGNALTHRPHKWRRQTVKRHDCARGAQEHEPLLRCRMPMTPAPTAAAAAAFTFNTPGSALDTPGAASPPLFSGAGGGGAAAAAKENAGANGGTVPCARQRRGRCGRGKAGRGRGRGHAASGQSGTVPAHRGAQPVPRQVDDTGQGGQEGAAEEHRGQGRADEHPHGGAR